MYKKITALVIICAITLTLAACGSKTDANEKNFGAAMTQYFDKKGNLCISTNRWPVDLTETDFRLKSFSINQMTALEAVGLAKGEDTEIDVMSYNNKPTGRTTKIKRYTLTDAAKPFMQERDTKDVDVAFFDSKAEKAKRQIDLCWGKKALDKIVKWEGQMKLGDYQEATVTYTYKVNNLADWAKKPEIQVAFPAVKNFLDGVGKKETKHGVKLTSLGWEARGLD